MDVEDATPEVPRVLVRATVHRQRFPAGEVRLVDSSDPDIAEQIRREILVVLDEESDAETSNDGA